MLFLCQALDCGATLRRNCEVVAAERVRLPNCSHAVWKLRTQCSGDVFTKVVINCAGLHGDTVENMAGESPFTIKPRKGQFAVYSLAAGALLRHIILPVPSAHTKGVIVFPSVYGHLVVGPTATEQVSRQDRSTDSQTIHSLHQRGVTILPKLADHAVLMTYAGLRPATQFPHYMIDTAQAGIQPDSKRGGWVTVGGIRSTGLTASLGIAHTVCEAVLQANPTVEWKAPNRGTATEYSSRFTQLVSQLPFAATSSDPAQNPLVSVASPRLSGPPDATNSDVCLPVSVTHPLTRLAMTEGRTPCHLTPYPSVDHSGNRHSAMVTVLHGLRARL